MLMRYFLRQTNLFKRNRFKRITGRSFKLIAGILIVLGLTLQLVACNPSSLTPRSQIVLAQLGNPKTFNPALANELPLVYPYTHESLLKENELTQELEGGLADKWEFSSDRNTITFTLRPDLKWSDGKPLTVDDVLFTYQDIFFNPEIPSDSQDAFRIGKDKKFPIVKKLDDRRISITAPEPFAPLLRQIGLSPILPKHTLEKTVKNKKDGKLEFLSTWGVGTPLNEIVGSGMYILDKYIPNQRLIFKKNPYYWRKDSKGGAMPYIDRIVWKSVDNQDTAMMQFRSGGPDVVEPIRPEDFALLKAEEKRGKFTVRVGGLRQGFNYLAFNLNKGSRNGKPLVDPVKSKWFNSTEFRQAVAYGLDLNRMVNNLYRGIGDRVHSSVPTLSPFYLSPEKGLKTYEYNPEKSKELLKKAGFVYNDKNELLDSLGNRVKFTIATNAENALRAKMVAQIKQDLGKLGMEVSINQLAFGVLLDKVDTALDWEAVLMGFGSGGTDPHNGANIWLTDAQSHHFNRKPSPESPQLERYAVSDWEQKINDLYIQGSQEMDEAKRKLIYNEAQQIAQEQLPFIYLVNAKIMAATRDRITGIRYPEGGEALWNLHELNTVD
jgi:peptide/nickel transport system substrate-binding protein